MQNAGATGMPPPEPSGRLAHAFNAFALADDWRLTTGISAYRKCQYDSPTRMWCIRSVGKVYATVIPKIACAIPSG